MRDRRLPHSRCPGPGPRPCRGHGDGRRHPPSRPRRCRRVGRCGWRHRAGPSQAGDHRPLGGGAPAYALRRRPLPARLQRRNLQPCRAARGAGGLRGGPRLARAFRYRDLARGLRTLGRRRNADPQRGHVRDRAVGCAGARAVPRTRPVRGKAALLRLGAGRLRLRIGAQGTARLSRVRPCGLPRGPGAVPAFHVRARAATTAASACAAGGR